MLIAEEKLILFLPCNVGDYVYQIFRSYNKIETKKVKEIICRIRGNGVDTEIIFETCGCCSASCFGITVFKNKAEAAAMLAIFNREKHE